MSIIPVFQFRRVVLPVAALICVSLSDNAAQARGKTRVNYVPGITLAADVLMPDGTPRTYTTPQGTTLWTEEKHLPIQQGDKVKLNVFVSTGGADLKEVKVKLDNDQIADISASPWNTTIDTQSLATGYHMVDVWTQATGDPPQSNNKALSFYVIKQLVKGTQETRTGGQTTEATPNSAPSLPSFLAAKPVDEAATVVVHARAASLAADAPSTLIGDSPVTIDAPTLFIVHTPTGSTAKQFVYSLTRDGQAILTSPAAYRLDDPARVTEIKIQGRTDTAPGLRPGTVMLWVWGIDAQGSPGSPLKVQLQIP